MKRQKLWDQVCRAYIALTDRRRRRLSDTSAMKRYKIAITRWNATILSEWTTFLMQ